MEGISIPAWLRSFECVKPSWVGIFVWPLMAGYGKSESPTVVLVTGGSGLVGKAINKARPRQLGDRWRLERFLDGLGCNKMPLAEDERQGP